MELPDAIIGFALDEVIAYDLPSVAMQAIEQGYSSPSLCSLAVAKGCETYELRRMFANAIDELGIAIPSPPEAGMAVAREIASEILNGTITPYAGAKRIWSEIYTRFPELKQLRAFVGYASEWEDNEKHRSLYEDQIMAECHILLQTSGQAE